MAIIVGIHGIAQQYKGGYQLGTIWYDSVRDGLTAGGHSSVAAALPPDGDQPHAIDLYLSSGHTGSAIGDALG